MKTSFLSSWKDVFLMWLKMSFLTNKTCRKVQPVQSIFWTHLSIPFLRNRNHSSILLLIFGQDNRQKHILKAYMKYFSIPWLRHISSLSKSRNSISKFIQLNKILIFIAKMQLQIKNKVRVEFCFLHHLKFSGKTEDLLQSNLNLLLISFYGHKIFIRLQRISLFSIYLKKHLLYFFRN